MLPAIIAALAPLVIETAAKGIFGADTPVAGKVTDAVVSVAAQVTGTPIADEHSARNAAQVLANDPQRAVEFQRLVNERTANELAEETKRLEAEIRDRENARARDLAYVSAGRYNWRADAMVALAVLGVIACVVSLVAGGIDGNSAVGGFIIGVGSLLTGKIGTAFDFEFGSSRSSSEKDKLLRGR